MKFNSHLIRFYWAIFNVHFFLYEKWLRWWATLSFSRAYCSHGPTWSLKPSPFSSIPILVHVIVNRFESQSRPNGGKKWSIYIHARSRFNLGLHQDKSACHNPYHTDCVPGLMVNARSRIELLSSNPHAQTWIHMGSILICLIDDLHAYRAQAHERPKKWRKCRKGYYNHFHLML